MKGRYTSSNNYSEISEIAGKRIKSYVYHMKDRYKLTCLIHGPGYSSYECKVLRDFGSKYSKSRPTKDHRNEPTTKKTFDIKQ